MEPEVSIVTPVLDEAEAAPALAREIASAFAGRKVEIIFVDDGSRDGTAEALLAIAHETPGLRLIRHGRNAGQSRAIRTGVAAARAPIVVTLDGDGQNDPADAPELVERLKAGGNRLAMVGGVRLRRRDSAWKRFGSRFANGVRRRLLNDAAADTGCGLKAFHREAYLALPFFDHQHRFLPALMRREGYEVAFAPVGHRPRVSGRSKYGNWSRLRASFADLAGVLWLMRRARDPGEITEPPPLRSSAGEGDHPQGGGGDERRPRGVV